MNPNVEPNEVEKAEAHLENFKTKYIVTPSDETILRQMLIDYVSEREQGSPAAASEIWARINKVLEGCKRQIFK